jgi:transmembrane sensor
MFDQDRIQSTKGKRKGRDEAAMWFLRLRENKVSEVNFSAWRTWLAKDEAHEQEFDEIVELWKACDQLEELPWPSEQEMGKEDTSIRSWYQDTVGAFLNLCKPRYALQAISVFLLVAVVAYLYQAPGVKQEEPINYRTTIAEHRTVDLLDGSAVTLGAKTNISVLYSDNTRSITLHQGEAYFKVSKDHNRPFLVSAGQRTIRAVGTAFNVNMGAEKVTVTVIEGLVRIEEKVKGKTNPLANIIAKESSDIRSIANVSGGHGIIYDSQGTLENIPESDAETATSWQGGRLVFIDKTLDSVIADINRYSSREIIISDDELHDLRYTGTVFQHEITGWLNGLDKAFPVRIIELGDRELVVIARKEL